MVSRGAHNEFEGNMQTDQTDGSPLLLRPFMDDSLQGWANRKLMWTDVALQTVAGAWKVSMHRPLGQRSKQSFHLDNLKRDKF